MSEPMPEDLGGLELAPGVRAPADAVRFAFTRASGPGGQNVNKLHTRAELRVALAAVRGLRPDALDRLRAAAGRRLTESGELLIVAQVGRSQEANRQVALEKLRQLLVQAMHRPRPRRATRPTRASLLRRRQAKRHRAAVKRTRRHDVSDE